MFMMHSAPKEQRETVRNLLRMVMIRDMGTFNPDRFKDWVRNLDKEFRKIGLTLRFEIKNRVVHFSIKEIKVGRIVFRFPSSTRLPFDGREVVMSYEEMPASR